MFRNVLLVIACVGMARADLLTTAELDTTINGVATLTCSQSGGPSAGCSSGDLTVMATASYTGGVDAAVNLNPSPSLDPDETIAAKVTASFSDTLTITGETGTGFADFTLVRDHNSFNAESFFATFQGVPYGGYGETGASVPFAFGVPFTIQAYAEASGTIGGNVPVSMSSSFIGVEQIEVNDASGTWLNPSGIAITAASGTQYAQRPYLFVPEPATALLIGPVLGLWWWRKR